MSLPHQAAKVRAWLDIIWCDRCHRAIDTQSDREHWHSEQCGGCRMFRKIDSDWGHCENVESVYCGRVMFEHDTCSKWLEGGWDVVVES